MSKLSEFIGKPVLVDLDGAKIQIKPLTVENLDVMMELGSPKKDKRKQALKDMLKITLMKVPGFEEVTDEEIINLPLCYYRPLIDAVMDVNGVKADKEELKKLEEQMENES